MIAIGLMAVLAYLIGSVPVGVIVCRLAVGQDPRTTGSGNAGATNVRRVAGTGWAMVTLAGDLLKGSLAVWLAIQGAPVGNAWGPAAAAVAAVIGHVVPVFLRCRPSGKGVATAVGAFAVLSPAGIGLGLIVFAGMVWWRRQVSVGSMAAALCLPAAAAVTGASAPTIAAAGVVSALIVIRHRGNIQRLLAGTEPRL